ncbi:MAG: AMP-binding protein, partial [Candidatus Obscuribacterales bacterium]|nr:AMP-binding protein [Candidatus Obscuribacterales bacterium]
VDQDSFWQANSIRDNKICSGTFKDGIVFKSGGTTGNPKFSIYSRDEWNLFCKTFGEGIFKAGLSSGDKLANLFYVGELYASFIFIMKCIEEAPTGALQFPISGSTKPADIVKTVDEFEINVLAGLPTTIMNVAEYYSENRSKYGLLKVEKILFGGESMYPDQRQRLQEIFPGVKIVSIGYASVDAGLLGYADASCGPDEHRVFGDATIFEIVDEDTLEPITTPNKAGKVLITNLIRSLMPIIRYPVGDRAIWTEEESLNKDRKYCIMGRSEEAARVGPVSVYYEDMRAFLESSNLSFQVTGFQLIIKHFEFKDALILRIASPERHIVSKDIEELIAAEFGAARVMFAEAIRDEKIHPLIIEWADPSEVEINSRTGKLRRVIDQRQ